MGTPDALASTRPCHCSTVTMVIHISESADGPLHKLHRNGSYNSVNGSETEKENELARSACLPCHWHESTALLFASALFLPLGMPHFCSVLAAAGIGIGPLGLLLQLLPHVTSRTDFENRHYRVVQSVWLVSVCCAVYTLIPDEAKKQEGWKQNLVTM